jgi:surfactin synthase thioesterase subunit
MSGSWLLRLPPRPRARVRLFCFPHAGGGGSAYRLWSGGLPEGVEVCAVQPPGRESRLSEPAAASVRELVEGLLPELARHLDLPFAFFGHSMGAVVAAETARALLAAGGPPPRHLVVSARRPPHLAGTEPPLHPLPDDAFVAEVQRRYGGIHPEVARHADLMALLLPGLRADIRALETHRPPPRPPLPCPVSAFGGADDRLTPRAHLDAWRGETSGPFRVRVFPGGHFYLDARRAELLADLAASLAPLARPQQGEATA